MSRSRNRMDLRQRFVSAVTSILIPIIEILGIPKMGGLRGSGNVGQSFALATGDGDFWPRGTRVTCTDVGGSSIQLPGSKVWQNVPILTTANRHRHDASAMFYVDSQGVDHLYILSGNSAANGELIRWTPSTRTQEIMVSGLAVGGNSTGVAPTNGGRPRNVGCLLANFGRYIYVAGDHGIVRHDTEGAPGNKTSIYAPPVRGFSPDAYCILEDEDELLVATLLNGVVKITNPSTNPQVVPVTGGQFDRAESIENVPGHDAVMVAADSDGIWRVEGARAGGAAVQVINCGPPLQGVERIVDLAVSPSGKVLAVVLNPATAQTWSYFNNDAMTADPTNWTGATNISLVTVLDGNDLQPSNRKPGSNPPTGQTPPVSAGFFGQWVARANPDPARDGEFWVGQMLTNLVADARTVTDGQQITWITDNENLSNSSVVWVSCTEDGAHFFYGIPDHFQTVERADEPNVDPKVLNGFGGNDGVGSASIGTGANKILVGAFAGGGGSSVAFSNDNDVGARFGEFPSNLDNINFSSTGWQEDLDGNPGGAPRPGVPVLFPLGNGLTRCVVWADGLGYVHKDVNPVTEVWQGQWTANVTGPSSVTPNEFRPRVLSTIDGSVLFGYELNAGRFWRSTDQGLNFSAVGPVYSEGVRQGDVVLHDFGGAQGQAAAFSNGDGTYLVHPAATGSPVKIGDHTGSLDFTPGGRLLVTSQNPGGILWMHEGLPGAPTSGVDIATDEFRAMGDGNLIQAMRVFPQAQTFPDHDATITIVRQGGGLHHVPFNEPA